MVIKEVKITDDDLENGVFINAVSFVPEPAMESDFLYFNKDTKKDENIFLSTEFKFEVSSKEKREVEGLAMVSGKFIYRQDVGDGQEGYLFFTRDTIRKLKDKYGYNRTITIDHTDNITGMAILLDSWLVENEEQNITEWYLKYKILNDKLWDVIKSGLVKGFSIEAVKEATTQ